MPSLRDKRVGIQSLVSYFFLDNVDKRIIISTVLLAIFKYGSTSIINPFSWWSNGIFRFFGFFRQRLSVNSLFIFLNYFPVSEFFRMSKGEIANSKNMVSIRICPRVDIRRKKSNNWFNYAFKAVSTKRKLGRTGAPHVKLSRAGNL